MKELRIGVDMVIRRATSFCTRHIGQVDLLQRDVSNEFRVAIVTGCYGLHHGGKGVERVSRSFGIGARAACMTDMTVQVSSSQMVEGPAHKAEIEQSTVSNLKRADFSSGRHEADVEKLTYWNIASRVSEGREERRALIPWLFPVGPEIELSPHDRPGAMVVSDLTKRENAEWCGEALYTRQYNKPTESIQRYDDGRNGEEAEGGGRGEKKRLVKYRGKSSEEKRSAGGEGKSEAAAVGRLDYCRLTFSNKQTESPLMLCLF